MENGSLYEIIKNTACGSELRSDEIPSIDLYIDQIISLVNRKLGDDAIKHGERLLTKTMINNYSKDGIIKPIKGKKYTKEHIIQMLLVYSLKGTVSITEIKRFIYGLYEDKGFDGEQLIKCYDRYVDGKKESHDRINSWIKEIIDADGLDLSNEEDFTVALLTIASLSSLFRYITQELIEEHYSDPEERAEKEKAESSKKAKAESNKKEKNEASKKVKAKKKNEDEKQ